MAMRPIGLRVLGAVLLGLGCASCASYSSMRFVPALQDVELRGVDDDVQARIAVACLALGEQAGVPALHFRVRVENPGPTPFSLLPAEFELLDAALSSFGSASTALVPTLLEPGGSATFDLAFPVPAGTELESFDLSTLTLRARFQGGHWDWSTTFQRERPYREPSPAWGFGFGLSIGL